MAAVQSIVMIKLYQRAGVPKAQVENGPLSMDLQLKAGTGQRPASDDLNLNRSQPAVPPFGSFGYSPGAWDPFQEFRSMRQQMDQMFNDSFWRFQQSPDFESLWDEGIFAPSLDVEESDDNYVIRMDIPGVDKSNISIDIDDRRLTVTGRVDEMIADQGNHHLRKERRSGEFRRTLILPGTVNADAMRAKYEKGVLTITMPKAADQGTSRRIEVD